MPVSRWRIYAQEPEYRRYATMSLFQALKGSRFGVYAIKWRILRERVTKKRVGIVAAQYGTEMLLLITEEGNLADGYYNFFFNSTIACSHCPRTRANFSLAWEVASPTMFFGSAQSCSRDSATPAAALMPMNF